MLFVISSVHYLFVFQVAEISLSSWRISLQWFCIGAEGIENTVKRDLDI